MLNEPKLMARVSFPGVIDEEEEPFDNFIYTWMLPERLSLPDSSTKMLSFRIALLDKKKAGENVPCTRPAAMPKTGCN